MSLVRQLVMANDFDIEGLVVATGCWRKNQSNTAILDRMVDAYGQVVSNLQVHDPEFRPSSTCEASPSWGSAVTASEDAGDGKDTEGSALIIAPSAFAAQPSDEWVDT